MSCFILRVLRTLALILPIVILAFTDLAFAMEEMDLSESTALPSHGSLADNFSRENIKYELKRLERTFQNIDDLFQHAIVKVQTISSQGELGEESIITLKDFLGLPNKTETIIPIIEKSLGRKLVGDEKQIINEMDKPTLPKAVRELWRNKYLSDKRAHLIVLKNAPMTSQEIIRLVESGAARTQTHFLVQLRTGSNFGDPLNLFEVIAQAIKKTKDVPEIEGSHPTPASLLTEPLAPEVAEALGAISAHEMISDASVIRELRRHFSFLNGNSMPIRFRTGINNLYINEPNGPSSVNPTSSRTMTISPSTISAVLVGNHYFGDHGSSLSNSLFANPFGITYGGAYNWEGRGVDWWLNYSSGFLGAGVDYTVNFDKGTSWSSGQPTYLSFGAMAGGWRNNLMIGFSLSTMFANSIGVGASAQISITREHDVSYLGQYPMDGMFPSIRGFHKIQIDDTVGLGTQLSVAMNFSAAEVPITVAFLAGASFTRSRVYRTHTNLADAQRLLTESDVAGVLYLLGKKIKESRIPKFDDPEIFQVGDEFVETKIGTLSGAFIIGLETMIPIYAARLGGSVDLSAEFELGIRRLPNDKFEVSIEPKRIYEMGFYGGILNILSTGKVKSLAVARKQIFMFDFNEPDARRAYFDLIHHGHLPTSEEIDVYTEDRGPEYLLTEFRAQNEALLPRGISRTYLEKVRISTNKVYMGATLPLMDAALSIVNKVDEKTRKRKERLDLHFDGIDREFVRSHAKSVATNGLVAVRKSVFGGRRSEGQGFSGRFNQDIFITHRRLHTIDAAPTEFAGNRWQFDSLQVHFQLEDTKITGDEENQMAKTINHLFSTFIGTFENKNSKALRIINIEREFTKRDLVDLTNPKTRELIPIASQTTGIAKHEITALLDVIKDKHADHQGLLIQHFIETNPGATGFAAIHQLLGAKPENLIIRTESGYSQAVLEAKKFIVTFSKPDQTDTESKLNLVPVKSKENKALTRDFYDQARAQLRELDNQLRLLYDDKYLIDNESPLIKIYGRERIRLLIDNGIRQDKAPVQAALVTARKTILEIMDLDRQGYSKEERSLIYKMAEKKRLRFSERAEILMGKYEPRPLDPSMEPDYVKKRLRNTWDVIAKIDDRISRLEDDHVMQYMDPHYVFSYYDQLLEMRRRLLETVAVDHLTEEEIDMLKEVLRTKGRYRLRFRRQVEHNYLIDGALASAYLGDSPYDLNRDDVNLRVPPMADGVFGNTAGTGSDDSPSPFQTYHSRIFARQRAVGKAGSSASPFHKDMAHQFEATGPTDFTAAWEGIEELQDIQQP